MAFPLTMHHSQMESINLNQGSRNSCHCARKTAVVCPPTPSTTYEGYPHDLCHYVDCIAYNDFDSPLVHALVEKSKPLSCSRWPHPSTAVPFLRRLSSLLYQLLLCVTKEPRACWMQKAANCVYLEAQKRWSCDLSITNSGRMQQRLELEIAYSFHEKLRFTIHLVVNFATRPNYIFSSKFSEYIFKIFFFTLCCQLTPIL